MTTTCQTIVDRAKGFSLWNPSLAVNVNFDLLSQIKADQQQLFTENAGVTRDLFQTTVHLTSNSATFGRVFPIDPTSLAALTAPPCERILRVDLDDGRQLSQVDIQDLGSEFPPRYTVRGKALIEVLNDWGPTGAIGATLTYVYGATLIDPTGDLTQLVAVPDEWVDLLALPLAIYLHTKDPGRPADELQQLTQQLGMQQQAFTDYLRNFGGVEVKRFVLPTPQASSGKK
jgi:hypothetical protein